eukprot:945508-Rhodomonas_salina.1
MGDVVAVVDDAAAAAALGKLRSEHATLLATCSSLMSSHANATPPQPWPQQPDPPQQQQHPAGATPQSAGAWSPAYAFRASAEGTMGAQSQGVSSVLVSTLMQREALNERILSNFMQAESKAVWFEVCCCAVRSVVVIAAARRIERSAARQALAPPVGVAKHVAHRSPQRDAPGYDDHQSAQTGAGVELELGFPRRCCRKVKKSLAVYSSFWVVSAAAMPSASSFNFISTVLTALKFFQVVFSCSAPVTTPSPSSNNLSTHCWQGQEYRSTGQIPTGFVEALSLASGPRAARAAPGR